MKTKVCTKCGVEKEMDLYPPDKRASDKKASQCRKCKILACKEYRKKHPEKAKQKRRETYLNNYEKVRLTAEIYREKNIKQIRKKHNEFNRINRKKIVLKRRDEINNLEDTYISQILCQAVNNGIHRSIIPDWLRDLKRLQLNIRREIYK